MCKIFLLIFTFLFLVFNPAFSQEQSSYSLAEAIDMALRNNPEVKVAEKGIEAAKGRKSQAFSLQQPDLSFSWEGIYPGQPLNKANTRVIGAEQTLEFPYKLFVRKSVSNSEIDISYENLSRTKSLITTDVKKAFYRVNYLQKLFETLESTLGLLRQFQEATLLKYQSGDLPYFEVIRAKAEIAKTQNEIIEAKKELISAKNNLNLLLGRKGSEDFQLKDELAFVPLLKNKSETVQEFSGKNHNLKIARLAKEREDKNLQLANLSFVPDLKFSGGFFSERGVKSEIEKAYELVKISQEQVLLFEKSILKEVDEELKAGINGYQYNQIEALSLLDIYRTNKTTKIEYYRALFNYLSALADLEVAGEISQ